MFQATLVSSYNKSIHNTISIRNGNSKHVVLIKDIVILSCALKCTRETKVTMVDLSKGWHTKTLGDRTENMTAFAFQSAWAKQREPYFLDWFVLVINFLLNQK